MSHFRSFLAIAIALVGLCSVQFITAVEAGSLPPAAQGPSGISTDRLEQIAGVLQEDIDSGLRAGYVAMVAKNGKVVYEVAAGMADREAGTPMAVETRFRIASMTKAVTTVAVMQLVEEGAVLLSDPVSKFIPAFADMRVAKSQKAKGDQSFKTEPLKRPITVHHLLTHTSGLDYGFVPNTDLDKLYNEKNIYKSDGDLAARIDQLTSLPLYEQPGEKYRYSYGVDVAGRIVEIASGKTLEDFMRERIFEPLEMKDTEFFLDESDFDRLAVTYDVDGQGKLVRAGDDPYFPPPNAEAQGWMSGGAGLVSTSSDYMRFLLMMLNEGELDGARILSPASVALMLQRHLPAKAMYSDGFNSEGYTFGLGGYVIERPGLRGEVAAAGQWGWGGYYDTMAFISPADELAVITLSQQLPWRRPPSRVQGRVKAISYGALE